MASNTCPFQVGQSPARRALWQDAGRGRRAFVASASSKTWGARPVAQAATAQGGSNGRNHRTPQGGRLCTRRVPPSQRCHRLTPRAASPSAAEAWASSIANLFPVWVVAAACTGLARPALYSWVQTDYITLMIGFTMLTMGFTLKLSDITDVVKNPGRVSIGAALQYTIMPALGFLFSRLPGMPTGFAAGIILVACCPGGTASNIVTFLARADVALSVMMTTVSTFAAVVMTPLLTTKLLGTLVPVNGMALFVSTLQVVLAPVLAGVVLKRLFPKTVDSITPYSPVMAVLMVALICGSVMARSAGAARQASATLFLAVFGLHAGGFGLGYGISKLLGLPEATARTNSIEVGMQNSTLGASLAILHFADPLTAAPCAISACMHSVLGSLLAAVWRLFPPEGPAAMQDAAV